MCLLALFYRVVDDAFLVAGANREEFYARGGEPPQILDGPLRSVGGRDPTAGGTWLAINGRGVLIAVTNRRKSQPPDRPRSRGLLVRQMLGCASASAAAELATRELQQNTYDGCNLVCVDSQRALAIMAGDWFRVRALPPGLHVLANRDINDESDPRVTHVLKWLGQWTYHRGEECLEALREVCRQHEPEYPAICFSGPLHGTVSSSLLLLPSIAGGSEADLAHGRYWHAQGSPTNTAYEDCSALLRQLS
jgi:uncharacterized protein with NRDE domain